MENWKFSIYPLLLCFVAGYAFITIAVSVMNLDQLLYKLLMAAGFWALVGTKTREFTAESSLERFLNSRHLVKREQRRTGGKYIICGLSFATEKKLGVW